jgi:hypothetical protein
MTTEMRYTLAKYDPFVVSLGYPSSAIATGPLDRVKIALFLLTRPVVDGGWAIWRRVRLYARKAKGRLRFLLKGESARS